MPHLDNARVVDADLSALAQDYHNTDFVWSVLAPVVKAAKETGKVPKFNKEHFQIHKTERALRAGSNRLNWEMGDPVLISMKEHDLEFPIDMRELDEAELIDLRQRGTTVTMESINLRLEKQLADLVQNPASYPTGSKIELTSSTDKWSDGTNSDPIGDIDTARDAISSKIVKDPNVVVFGRDAWRAFKRHPQVLALISGGGSPGAPAVLTTDIAAKILDIPKVVVGNALYLNNGTPTRVWGDNVILAYVPDTPPEQRSVHEPSFAYSIRKDGYPQVDTYPDAGGKIDVVRNTDIVAQAIVGAEAGYLIQNVL